MLKYIYMGSPPFAATILEKLCTDLYPPVAVVTQEAKAAGRGQKLQPTAVEFYAKEQQLTVFSTLNVNAPATFEVLQTLQPDLILVAAFGQILRNEVLSLPKIACLNVHGSILPKYRGAAPVQRAILDGEARTGITIQKMARKLDTGDILLQREIEIQSKETSGELMARLARLGGECLVDSVRLIEAGKQVFTPQDHEKATYAAKLDKTESNLDWQKPAAVLQRQVYGLQPWPVADTSLAGVRLKVFGADIVDGKNGAEPGTILTDSRSRLAVQCGDGRALTLTEIQLENRKRLPVGDFLKGYRGSFPHTRMN